MDLNFGPLFSSLMISTLGTGFLIYGKKADKPIYMLMGLVFCVYPFFITNVPLLWIIAGLLLIPLFLLRRA